MDEKKFNDHLEKLKEHEPDLYEDMELEEIVEVFETNQTKKKKTTIKKESKLIIAMIAFFMLASVVGTLGSIISIPAIQFLQKSYELSKLDFIEEYKKAVVTVKVDNSKGTGFNVREDGLIVTNYHVVEENEYAAISFADGSAFQAKVVKTMPSIDIAFLTVEAEKHLPFLPLDTGENWEKGDHVHFVGNPLMFNLIANEGEIVGKTSETSLRDPVIMMDAPVYKGNSGSPVINEKGKVIAVIYATKQVERNGEKEKLGLAVPVPSFLEELKKVTK